MGAGFSEEGLNAAMKQGANDAIRYINDNTPTIERLPENEKDRVYNNILSNRDLDSRGEASQVSDAFHIARQPIDHNAPDAVEKAEGKAAGISRNMNVGHPQLGHTGNFQDLDEQEKQQAAAFKQEFKDTARRTENDGRAVANRLSSKEVNPNIEAGVMLGEDSSDNRNARNPNVGAVAASRLKDDQKAGPAANILASGSGTRAKVEALDRQNGGGNAVGQAYEQSYENRDVPATPATAPAVSAPAPQPTGVIKPPLPAQGATPPAPQASTNPFNVGNAVAAMNAGQVPQASNAPPSAPPQGPAPTVAATPAPSQGAGRMA